MKIDQEEEDILFEVNRGKRERERDGHKGPNYAQQRKPFCSMGLRFGGDTNDNVQESAHLTLSFW